MKYLIIFLLFTFSLASAKSQTESDTTDHFICSFYPPPEFPGGFDSLRTFIKRSVNRKIVKDCDEGTVDVQFMVDEVGAISHIRVMKGLAKECNDEAVRIVKSMPKWSRAQQWGKPLKVVITYPIRFSSL